MGLDEVIHELVEANSALAGRCADLEARIERMFRPGVVTDVDPARQRYRQEIGIDAKGQPVKGPWVPYSQVAGARKIHSPPSIGQQMMLISPDGDHPQAFGVPLTWSKGNPSPSTDGGADVETRGSVKITNDGAGFTIEASGVVLKVSADGVAVTGGRLTHDGKDVGKTHKHVGVRAGGDQTGVPA